jgi:hypothetical protein
MLISTGLSLSKNTLFCAMFFANSIRAGQVVMHRRSTDAQVKGSKPAPILHAGNLHCFRLSGCAHACPDTPVSKWCAPFCSGYPIEIIAWTKSGNPSVPEHGTSKMGLRGDPIFPWRGSHPLMLAQFATSSAPAVHTMPARPKRSRHGALSS